MPSLPELEDFLRTASWPPALEWRPTFFSIAGFPHYENVLSNVYQFFFNTASPHGLGTLCTEALLDVVGEAKKRSDCPWKRPDLRRVNALRELQTSSGRLDLLLHNGQEKADWTSTSTTLLIENKVYHGLFNDLGEYYKFVAEGTTATSITGIVLGLKREVVPAQWQDDWIAVTHLEWGLAVEKRLGALVYRAEPRYVTLLLELIENIKRMSNSQEQTSHLLRFFQQHYNEVQHLEKLKEQLLTTLPVEIGAVLPPGYAIESQSKDGKYNTWLVITSPLQQSGIPSKYLIQYGGLFKQTSEPRYSIYVINHDYAKCEEVRHAFRTSSHLAVLYGERHYAVSKDYTMTTSQLSDFAQHIAASLKQDWIPREQLWLGTTGIPNVV